MDLKVAWSPEAIEDLESIAEYIGRDSEFYAHAVATKIVEMARSIESFPRSGRVVPELGDSHELWEERASPVFGMGYISNGVKERGNATESLEFVSSRLSGNHRGLCRRGHDGSRLYGTEQAR